MKGQQQDPRRVEVGALGATEAQVHSSSGVLEKQFVRGEDAYYLLERAYSTKSRGQCPLILEDSGERGVPLCCKRSMAAW